MSYIIEQIERYAHWYFIENSNSDNDNNLQNV